MRVALAVVLFASLLGCAAKKSAEPATESPDKVGAAPPGGGAAAATSAPTAEPPPPPPAPTEGAAAPKGSGSAAVDQARSSGVLGPTDQAAFTIKSSVAIKRASTNELDTTAKTNLDAVKACYDKALEFNENLSGELTLAIKAGKATVAKSTLGNAELEKCVVAALTSLPKNRKGTLLLAFTRQDAK